jgi:hypothetical protein
MFDTRIAPAEIQASVPANATMTKTIESAGIDTAFDATTRPH